MASKHMRRGSTPLSITEIQIKTTMRYHFTTTRKATYLVNRKITSVHKNVEKLECKMGQLL